MKSKREQTMKQRREKQQQRKRRRKEKRVGEDVNKHIDDDYQVITVVYLEWSTLGDGSLQKCHLLLNNRLRFSNKIVIYMMCFCIDDDCYHSCRLYVVFIYKIITTFFQMTDYSETMFIDVVIHPFCTSASTLFRTYISLDNP